MSRTGRSKPKSRSKTSGRSNKTATVNVEQKRSAHESPFAGDNAKLLSPEQAVAYFVPPPGFDDLFVAKNHILLGSRGSGKTTLVRMLAHDHVLIAARLPAAEYDYARRALAMNVIGIYVPTNTGMVGSLFNKPWQNREQSESHFQWRLNLHTCSAFLPVIRSCIENYIPSETDRLRCEYNVCSALSELWTGGSGSATTVEMLGLALWNIEAARSKAAVAHRAQNIDASVPSDYFDTDLFYPIKHAAAILAAFAKIPPTARWMICIDEAEYLSVDHHRILNTHLRTSAGNFVFKIATMPFAHHTLETNSSDPVREPHDFEYVYVDQAPVDSRGSQTSAEFLRFARNVYSKRVRLSTTGISAPSLRVFLGASELLDDRNYEGAAEISDFMGLLRQHANDATFMRARNLLDTNMTKFRNEILRKLKSLVLLREAVKNQVGNSKLRVYSGEAMVVRCSDGNARRLLRILNVLFKKAREASEEGRAVKWPLDAGTQNDALLEIAEDIFYRVQSEPPNGRLTFSYLKAIGEFVRRSFTVKRLGSDTVSSVEVLASDGPNIQHFARQSLQLSLMTASRSTLRGDSEACFEGVLHLGFIFSPLFHFLPRRNKAHRLPGVIAPQSAGEQTPIQIGMELG